MASTEHPLLTDRHTNMPFWSIEDWRAHIGSSWCALGISRKPSRRSKGVKPNTDTWHQIKSLVAAFLTAKAIFCLICFLLQTTSVDSCLLIRSGDVELNPGPDLDYDSVDNHLLGPRSRALYLPSYSFEEVSRSYSEDDLKDVIQAVASLKSKYYPLGVMLGLRSGDLQAIQQEHSQNSQQALNDVVQKWLNQDYNTMKYGMPSWRALVMAVENESGGGSHALDKRIAEQYPAGLQAAGVSLNSTTEPVLTPTHSLSLTCREMLATYYLRQSDGHAWPPVKQNFFSLALIKDNVRPNWRTTFRGSVEDLLSGRNHLSYQHLFDDIARLDKKFILIEGRPGSGKTVLIKKIVCDWANGDVLKSYLVIFVPLQNLNAQRDRSLQTILKVTCPALPADDLKQLASHIEYCQGKGVVFVFDGLDEYKPRYSKRKIQTAEGKKSTVKREIEDIHEIMYGHSLIKAVVLLTSRPSACIEFRRFAGKKIEVLGFLKGQIFEYIKHYFGDDTSKAQQLIDHLHAYPNLLNMCYLPLHCAMLVFFYEEDEVIPTTETEIYKHFMLSTIYRAIKKNEGAKSKLVKLASFGELPKNYRELFTKICHLAFDAMIDSKKMFTSSDVKHIQGVGKLGLVVKDRYYMKTGEDESYNFQHLTTQEYLAAVYIAGLPEKKQIKLINAHGCKDNLQVMWRFFCGMMLQKAQDTQPVFQTLVEMNTDTLTRIYYAYEAHQPQPCQHVIQSLKHRIQFSKKQLSRSDCCVIGTVVHQANKQERIAELEFEECSTNVEAAFLFLQQVGDCPFSLELRNGNAVGAFLEALSRSEQIQSSEFGRTGLTKLILSGNNLGSSGFTHYLAKGLKICTEIQYLDLDDNDIGDDGALALAQGITHCASLRDLQLKGNRISSTGCEALVRSLKSCTNFRSLHLWENNINDIAVPHLIDLISTGCLEKLGLWRNKFSSAGKKQLEEAVRARNSSCSTKLSVDISMRF